MKTNPYNRHETFLAALTDSSITVPGPLTREELYLAKIAGETVTIPDAPLNRYETYLAKLAGENVTVPVPAARLETYLYKACGHDIDDPVPVSREEVFWKRYVGSEVTGSTVTIPDALVGAPKSVILSIPFVQEGTGTASESNPRPIKGWNTAVITVTDADGTDTEYSFDMGNTVGKIAAGTVDVLNGDTTVTMRVSSPAGSSYARVGASGHYYFRVATSGDAKTSTDTNSACSHFKRTSGFTASNTNLGYNVTKASNGTWYIAVRKTTEDMTKDQWADYVDGLEEETGTPLQIAYTPASPIETTFTPPDIVLTAGANTITCNCGTITIKYTPDI